MKALVFGSLNIDRVYSVSHLPEKGETLPCGKYEIHVGGKGLNQSVALSNSGMKAFMAGHIGADGLFLRDYLDSAGVDTSLIEITNGYSGHAVIEVAPDGQNQMIIFTGANHGITAEYCDRILENFSAGDLILMQNETSQVEYMIDRAHKKGLVVAFNPSPYVDKLKEIEYDKIDYLILNEDEGEKISGESEPNEIVKALCKKVCNGAVILTLGKNGAIFSNGIITEKAPAFEVEAVDTTGAGDTFTGYALNSLLGGKSPAESLKFASAASAIAVTKNGAAETIPNGEQVKIFLDKRTEE